MQLQELLKLHLKEEDFQITISGVLIKYNSNIIKKILNDQNVVESLRARIEEIDTLLDQKHQTYCTMFDALEAKGKADINPNHYYQSEYNALNKILEDEEELRKEQGYIKSILESKK